MPIAMLLVVYRLVIRGRNGRGFSLPRAQLRVEDWRGPNMMLILSVLSITNLLFDGAVTLSNTPIDAGYLVAAALILLVVAIIPKVGDTLIAVAGIAAGFAFVGANHGPVGVVAAIVLSMMLLWLTAIGRGFIGR